MKLLLFFFGIFALSASSERIFSSRIYNGDDATDGQFPYMALWTYGGNEVKKAWKMCGAGIIHKRWVITAAHCIIKYYGPLITVGTTGDFGTGTIYEPEKSYVHENYTLVPEWQNNGLEIVYNDIALIRLKSDIEFNDLVQKVKLETDENKNYNNVNATIAGWGREDYYGDASDHLRYATVPVMPLSECRKIWSYADKHVCTYNKKKGVCNGDSGSPLVVDGVQIGITSTTDTFCQSLKPDMYTKVASFIPWIKIQLAKYGEVL